MVFYVLETPKVSFTIENHPLNPKMRPLFPKSEKSQDFNDFPENLSIFSFMDNLLEVVAVNTTLFKYFDLLNPLVSTDFP